MKYGQKKAPNKLDTTPKAERVAYIGSHVMRDPHITTEELTKLHNKKYKGYAPSTIIKDIKEGRAYARKKGSPMPFKTHEEHKKDREEMEAKLPKTRVCISCKEEKPLKEFKPLTARGDRRRLMCYDCYNSDNKTRAARDRVLKRQELFLYHLERNAGNIALASKATGINRSTHTNWVATDEDYAKKVEEVMENTIDWVEGKMMTMIKGSDGQMIRFYLKTRGKHRGYTEHPTHIINNTNNNNLTQQVTINTKFKAYTDEELNKRIQELEEMLKTGIYTPPVEKTQETQQTNETQE